VSAFDNFGPAIDGALLKTIYRHLKNSPIKFAHRYRGERGDQF
jgi:hypothetical protein